MIRLVHLFADDDGRSHVAVSSVELVADGRDVASPWAEASAIRFQQSPPGSALEWHDAPQEQYVITLTGHLRFTTRDGETFTLAPGDVLLAADTSGGGHRWELTDDQPWTRAYVELPTHLDGGASGGGGPTS